MVGRQRCLCPAIHQLKAKGKALAETSLVESGDLLSSLAFKAMPLWAPWRRFAAAGHKEGSWGQADLPLP